MRVTVHYLAQIKRAAGCSSETVDMPKAGRLHELLVILANSHDTLRALLLDDANQPHKSLLFFVGDEHVTPAQILREGESVTILTPMAGG